MSRLFSEHYQFTIPEDYFYSVDDIAPTTGNRNHKHSDVEQGLDSVSSNWECIGSSNERRRGSDKLYLVNDAHYIWCSRTGMESAGNTVQFSKSTPENIRFRVLKSVFEHVASRNFGEIKNGEEIADAIESDSFSISSPRQFVLAKELTEEEISDYYDDISEVTIELLEKYYDAVSIEELKEVVEWWRERRKHLFREYIEFEPSIMSTVVPEFSDNSEWRVPSDVDEGASLIVILYEDISFGDEGEYRELFITLSGDSDVELGYSKGRDDIIIEEKSYETDDGLRSILAEFLSFSPGDIGGL